MPETARPLPPVAAVQLDDLRAGRLSRREFLTRITALGVSAPAALALAEITAAPRPARAAVPRPGGVLRVQMDLKPLVDPRLADRSQLANFTRGWLEYLVQYNPGGAITGRLLQSWSVNADATAYDLELRAGVRWSNGDAFTTADVVHNLSRWCESAVPGNSMANRLTALIDPATGAIAADAIELLDERRLRLHLRSPDATLIASLADYPAAITHRSYHGGDPLADPIGTGPYFPDGPDGYAPGITAALVRRDAHWWNRGNGAWLDRIEYHDLGPDPAVVAAAAAAGTIDLTYETTGTHIAHLDAIGWPRSEVASAATLAVRFNLRDPVLGDPRIRRALTLAVDNAVVLELGYDGFGAAAENHHVSPLQPDYAPLPARPADPAAAWALISETGWAAESFELRSLDDEWQAAACDAIAAQCRDAGIDVRRRRLAAAEYLADWKDHPWSATEWNMRPLGVQVLALAYRSNAAWNESGFADPEFDALLDQALAIADAGRRQQIMARLQAILQEQAVIIQPFWRRLCCHRAPHVQGVAMHPMLEQRPAEWWIGGDDPDTDPVD